MTHDEIALDLCRGWQKAEPRTLDEIAAFIAGVKAALAPGNGAVEAESSIDFHQLRGRSHDIIQEAITTYDEWMLDDDYEATPVLRKIIERMRERIAPTLPATQGDGE